MAALSPAQILRRYRAAQEKRALWESHWRECYAYALPQRNRFEGRAGARRMARLFDGTALDAVEQLAASLLSQLTPPWSRWFGLEPGREVEPSRAALLAPLLERTADGALAHFHRSNFAVEMHQCFLDLVTAGTACLLFEENAPGAASAFRFTAVPLFEVVFEEDATGALSTTMRRRLLTPSALRNAYPRTVLPPETWEASPEAKVAIIEAVWPCEEGYVYAAFREDKAAAGEEGFLAYGHFAQSPFINFRWMKAPGEVYGRSPVMKALPEIKTANKVVELVLKNATIAVTGIWQAEDDGVLNPANIRLVPGAVIPKAMGSRGLTPLEAPGRFDVSQLVLSDLRGRIRSAMMTDRLGPPQQAKMTATEVLERTADTARLLGATYGRLQSELLDPLVTRALALLRRRGAIEDIAVDGTVVAMRYDAPLARMRQRQDARNVLMWLDSVASLGAGAMAVIDHEAVARWLARMLGVPSELLRTTGRAEAAGAVLAGIGEALPAVAAAAAPADGGAS